MFDTYGLRTINKWTTGLVNHPKRMENLVKLKNCNDFLFFSRLKPSYSSSIAEKSFYHRYVWFNHFNYQIAKTSRKRQEIS